MRAMALHAVEDIQNNPLRFEEAPAPVPMEHEILISVQVCGICHTDLHTIEGEIIPPRLPLIPGHQIIGTIVDLGSKVTRVHTGERVGVPWVHHTCGMCGFCLHGKENLCEAAIFTGFHVHGGYAEFAVAHEDFVYPIPEAYPASSAAPLLCAGIIGYRALRLTGVTAGQHLGIYGFGASAHIALQVARYWGCAVSVFSRQESHRNLAERLGAHWTGSVGMEPPEKPDASIIFAPAGWLVPEALQLLKKGGKLVLAGIYMDAIPALEYERHLFYEKQIQSVTAATREDAKELLQLAPIIPIETEIQVFELPEANRALQELKTGKINGAGVLRIR